MPRSVRVAGESAGRMATMSVARRKYRTHGKVTLTVVFRSWRRHILIVSKMLLLKRVKAHSKRYFFI